MLKNDLSLAGAGLGQGAAIVLPTSTTLPVYGCAQTTSTCYINSGSVKYPVQGSTPYLYGLIPGYQAGPTLNTMPTDVITIVYTDPTFLLNCYTATVTNATTVNFTAPSPFTTWAATGCIPSYSSLAAPQSVSDTGVGLTPGDLVWFSFPTPVVAEVTAVSGSTVTFAASDALKMNQASATNSLAKTATNTTGTGTRILAISYYLDNTPTPPRLMRQVSGHLPMPVAENVVYLQFTYDLFNDSTGTAAVGCHNPGAAGDTCTSGSSSGLLPNQITKINIANMAMDSTMNGGVFAQNGYQRMDLQTSVSARNLTYVNNYPQ
jgi:hypothetical protein